VADITGNGSSSGQAHTVSIFNAITLIGQGTASEKLDLFAMLRGRSYLMKTGPKTVTATVVSRDKSINVGVDAPA